MHEDKQSVRVQGMIKLSLYTFIHSTLEATIRERNLSGLKPFPPGKPELFSSFLDNIMGFGHS